jgi:hypothetical protein
MTRESPFCKRDEIADSPTHLSRAFLARCQFVFSGKNNELTPDFPGPYSRCASSSRIELGTTQAIDTEKSPRHILLSRSGAGYHVGQNKLESGVSNYGAHRSCRAGLPDSPRASACRRSPLVLRTARSSSRPIAAPSDDLTLSDKRLFATRGEAVRSVWSFGGAVALRSA